MHAAILIHVQCRAYCERRGLFEVRPRDPRAAVENGPHQLTLLLMRATELHARVTSAPDLGDHGDHLQREAEQRPQHRIQREALDIVFVETWPLGVPGDVPDHQASVRTEEEDADKEGVHPARRAREAEL